MKYKVLVLDLDGTLTNSKKKITDYTKKILLNLQKKGVHIVLASGRPEYGSADSKRVGIRKIWWLYSCV